jgi:hypothetical protein
MVVEQWVHWSQKSGRSSSFREMGFEVEGVERMLEELEPLSKFLSIL